MAILQWTNINKILEQFNMENCDPNPNPITKGNDLNTRMCPTSLEEIERMKKILYKCAMGSMMYAIKCTRSDISYAIGLAS